MTIGIIDVDGHNQLKKWGSAFPNLVCMKIAGYHKRLGDAVEWAVPGKHYDRIYASKVFTFKPDIDWNKYIANEIFRGGGQGMILNPFSPTKLTERFPIIRFTPG